MLIVLVTLTGERVDQKPLQDRNLSSWGTHASDQVVFMFRPWHTDQFLRKLFQRGAECSEPAGGR